MDLNDRPQRSPRRSVRLALLVLILVLGLPALFVAGGLAVFVLGGGPPPDDGLIRVYTASRIITMDPKRPFAQAIAVQDGKILSIGELTDLESALAGQPYALDEQFADQVILPGFIDPHIHLSLALMFNVEIVAAMEWQKPSGRTKAIRGREAFLDRIAELASKGEKDEWLLTWGYHEPYHGRIRRADLDRVARDRPVLLWQRSAHEMIFNSAALEKLEFSEEDFEGETGSDWETGHLWESGLLKRMNRIAGIFMTPDRLVDAIEVMKEVIHSGGLTTVGEQGFPQQSAIGELLLHHYELRGPDTSYRWVLVPNALYLMRENGDAVAAEKAARSLLKYSTERARIVRHAKYYSDGAIFAQQMQMSEPYLDGHHGEWMAPPEDQQAILNAFWSEGWSLHAHVNGDAGVDLILDQFEATLAQHGAQPGQRLILEHYGYARPDQHERLRRLGVEVSNNAYYAHELAPIYAEVGLGPERASNISPLGGLAEAGVPFSFHSDFPMAPAEPLRQVWVAVNRIGSDGRVWGPGQRISLDLALRAITIEGARSLGLEDEIGSLEAGKRADFTILGTDPYLTPPMDLQNIPIRATMLDGRIHSND